MEATRQPGLQTRLGRGQIDTGHANLGESKLQGPGPNQGKQLTAVELSGGEGHPPIVKSLLWKSEADTQLFAAALAGHPELRHAFIELHGDLGAGKTTLVRHLLQALGVSGRIKSPTYAVVEPYELDAPSTTEAGETESFTVWHFDFYRFGDPREWEDAGFRDIFASRGLKLAEWPEKAATLLPRADLVLRIEAQADDSRVVTLTANTPTGESLLEGLPG